MDDRGMQQNRDASVVVDRPMVPSRLAALRAELKARGLDGWLVPLSDEHHNEYVPLRAQRLAWLTGFTGSAGFAMVLREEAAIFVDGRYTLQVRDQVDAKLFAPHHVTESPPAKWLAAHAPVGKLGYDPWLHTVDEVERLSNAATAAGGSLVADPSNAIDAVWPDQPQAPLTPVVPHPAEFSGEDAAAKRARVAQVLADAKVAAAVISAPDSIAWLLNIRGDDVPHTPLPLSFAILRNDGSVELFVDPRKLTPETREHLGNAVAIRSPDEFGNGLDALGKDGARVQCDPATGAAWIFERLKQAGAQIQRAADPCQLPKARKNAVELDGTRTAHRRDGAALTRFLAWLSKEAAAGRVDELGAAAKLEELRRDGEHFRDLSFDTIAGSGPNGAIVHYRSTPASNRQLQAGELFLLDSGAQYLDGTTDVTRTIAIGTPSQEMRDRFTRVLKGHIALAMAKYPAGTSGSQLDALARRPLWEAGLDFDHGTGHGVGSYLGVHEGPQRISKIPNTVALEPGMIVSNEPGYYKTGGYGIRIENLVAVRQAEMPEGAERPLLEFETLTRAPIDLNLVDATLLTPTEIAWLDAYHATVRADIAPLVDSETREWLEQATRPLG
jgi:Xaa-Pro aminopeptidase